MQQQLSLKLLPSDAQSDEAVKSAVAASIGASGADVTGFHILKRSIDARAKQAWINLTVKAFINEPFFKRVSFNANLQQVNNNTPRVIIVGAGPAGLFAALYLLEKGIKPVILERGKDVRARRRDLAALNKQGLVDPDSNYCFGEGGAGTYSDGKLYTRSTKRGDVSRILNLFVQFGADEEILYEAHPHIGTNKLPHIITAIRDAIIAHGGEFIFEKKVTGFGIDGDKVVNVVTSDGDIFHGHSVILATGHSARDIFSMLHYSKILIESKPFALGVRVEHPQALIDSIQYNRGSSEAFERSTFLPPAAYSVVEQVAEKGVFSFCMCPGGIIAPASTNPGELVVNGWSPSKRNNFFANSGMVVTVNQADLLRSKEFKVYCKSERFATDDPLSLMHFQQMVERSCFIAGGGAMVAPAQRLADFGESKMSTSLPECSYLPGIASTDLRSCLPAFIYKSLQGGFKAFGKKMKGYYTNEAVLVATESRTSSPVRIPRHNEYLSHPQLSNLFPCAEGAGYAGGIVSAAMDGERVAAVIAEKILQAT